MRCFLILLLAATAAIAQNSYSASHAWWEPNQEEFFPWDSEYDNPTGLLRIANPNGSFRTGGHPFFVPLGTNGRACITCHQPSNAMSLSRETIRKRWLDTNGKDPLFAAIDGSNCPTLPQSQRSSHSLLLDRGLFRVSLPWPPKDVTPDFRIEVLNDPTTCNADPRQISVYRRPRMSANLATLTPGPNGPVLMADGRAPSLRAQAIDAVLVHQQAAHPPTDAQLTRILDFELQVVATQYADHRGGLTAHFHQPEPGTTGAFRASVHRGKNLFANRCANCHQPGTTRWASLPQAESPELPLFKITCNDGRVTKTQDPGRALITGKCNDVGALVIPQFHGLAARAPYFTNGSAATVEDLIDSYQRLNIRFQPEEKRDLVNYLLSL